MDSDYDRSSTENEFEDCYPNRMNQGIPAFASKEGVRYQPNKQGPQWQNQHELQYNRTGPVQKESTYSNMRSAKQENQEFYAKRPAMQTQKFDEVKKYLNRSETSQEGSYGGQSYAEIHSRAYNNKPSHKVGSNIPANYGEQGRLPDNPKERAKQAMALQKKMEEDRYTAINKLLEARRQALEADSDEMYQSDERYEGGRHHDEESFGYNNEEEEYEEEEDVEYGEDRHGGYRHNDRSPRQQQEYYYEDEMEDEEEDENLTYEQIIREDAVPKRDAPPLKSYPHVQPQYLAQTSTKGYGNPAIFSNQAAAQEKYSEPKKKMQLKTLQSDYLNDTAEEIAKNTRSYRAREEVEQKQTDVDALRRVYNQLQVDLSQKNQTKSFKEEMPREKAMQRATPVINSRNDYSDESSYREYVASQAKPQVMEDNRRPGHRQQDSTSSTRVNRWAKPEPKSKNEPYDMGHQMQREKAYHNQREEGEEDEILENYKYKAASGKFNNTREVKEYNIQPKREESYYEPHPEESMYDPRGERKRSNPFINQEALPYKDNTGRVPQSRENTARPVTTKETPQKAYGFYPEEVDHNTNPNFTHSSPSNRNVMMNTWVDSNMPNESHGQRHETYPQSQPQSNFSSTQNIPTKSPFRQNRDSVQQGEERPRSVSRRQTPTLSQNTSYYQAPPTLTSSPVSNLNRTQDTRSQNPQSGMQYPAQPQFSAPASTQNQYPPQMQAPMNPNYQANMGYPNPNQQFQYPNLMPLQYGHPINPQINPHSPHIPAGYVVPPLMQTINPAGYPHYVQGGIGQPVYTSPAPVATPQHLVTDQGYMYYPNYSTLPTQPNVSGVAGYPTINTGSMIINPTSMSSTPNARYAKPPAIPAGKEEGVYQQKKEAIEEPIKNYIKEQEEFLKKLENDKKQAAERRKAAATPQTVAPTYKEKNENAPLYPKSAVLDSSAHYDSNEKPISLNQTKQSDFSREYPPKVIAKISPSPQKFVIEDNFHQKNFMESDRSPNKAKPRIFDRKGSQGSARTDLIEINEKDFNVPQYKPRTPVREAPRNLNIGQEQGDQGWKAIPSQPGSRTPKQVLKEDNFVMQPKGQWGAKQQQIVNQHHEFEEEERGKENVAIIVGDVADEEGPSLAERFMMKKKKMAEKYDHKKEASRFEEKEQKPTRTKEEILQQRKAMMEYKGPAMNRARSELDLNRFENNVHDRPSKSPAPAADRFTVNPFQKNVVQGKKEPNPELLERLAHGTKAKVSKKEMKDLTNKNYELLPEVKKRKEEERKREETRKRLEKVKELNQKVRGNLQTRALKHNESYFG